MLWVILLLLFMVYVIYTLSSIKYQLKLISKHLKVNEKIETVKISNEEIEKILEDEGKQ
ncbi:hypothetical protein MKZ20_13975 [Psychrobacillus sp. FSL K6-2684]|uniref:hypothetical protein n=1 Tax=unclassified Psychrobacillus TaxID=2636677 RepID=UPI0016434926|nr:hypothetical protein [Psychrobacillus sp. AK 1817]